MVCEQTKSATNKHR